MKRNIKNTIRIIMIILLNIITIISISFFISSDISRKNYETERDRYNTLKSVQESVDSILAMNVNLSNTIALSSEAAEYANGEEINYYSAAKLADLLQEYAAFSESSIYVFHPGKNIYITKASTNHDEDLIKKYGVLPYDMEYLEKQPGGAYSSYSMNKRPNNGSVVYVNKCITVEGDYIYFIISLEENTLKKFLKENDTSVCLVEDGEIVFGNKEYEKHIKNEKYIKSVVPSRVIHNWDYVYVSDESGFMRLYIKWILLSFIGIILASIAGWWIATVMYRPIKNVLERISGDDVVENELEYIERKVSEMKKSHDRLLNEANEYFNRFEQQVLKNILFGISTHDEIAEFERRVAVAGMKYSVVLLECVDDEEIYSRTFYEICEYIRDLSGGRTVGLADKKIAVILYYSGEEDIIKKFTMLLIGAEQRFNVCYIGAAVNCCAEHLEEISDLFAASDRTLRNKALFDGNVMLEAKLIEDNDYYYTIDMEKIIIDYIKNGNFEDALAAIDAVLRRNLIECELSHESLTDFKLAMVSTIKRTLKMLGKDETELFGDDCIMYIELGAMRTAESMRERINDIFKTIFDSWKDKTEGNNSNILVENILKYIHENYADPDKVCLIGMAGYFNVSTSYVSRIFKKYTNVNYKEYVTQYRIERAKELLLGSGYMKVKDVAEAVGYSNVNSFIRAFDRLEGVSPDNFRRR